ncbi:ABC transporter ATP-binding protein/permease [Aliivibrio fischeri]|uniref:ABC transporter ATP-binding protein n=1 Tax=Aliivibrio fischeri TaxID=668 RepID=UPI001F26ECDE|nr:ABC transporter ATP-binding protein [Aliivibrio fischeri]MCE7578005.1 ABC transporter ATP-binding protein/permease [Aliivibrio fischeri]MCE7590393.1 ABC transporter ATP-binding protein/permease [Aliivibrio fischeri]
MFKAINRLSKFFNKKEKIKVFFCIVLITIVSFFELLGLALIAPYASLILNIERLNDSSDLWAVIYNYINYPDVNVFIVIVGIAIAFFILFGNLISVFSTFYINKIACQLGALLSSRLFNSYLYKEYSFHKEINSSVLINNITQQCQRVVNGVFIPLFSMVAKFIIILIITVFLFVNDPVSALVMGGVLSSFYMFIYLLAKGKLEKIGVKISEIYEGQIKLLNESLEGIKVIKLKGLEDKNVSSFFFLSSELASNNSVKVSISQSIRFIVEGFLFSFLTLILAFIAVYGEGIQNSLPSLILLSLAGYKLLPSFQNIFHGLSTLRSEINAFLRFEEHLERDNNLVKVELYLSNDIIFENVKFNYSDKVAIKNLNLRIKNGTKVGIVGGSGSGKSTFVDILLGLQPISDGRIIHRNDVVNQDQYINWKSEVGYVPQDIILIDDSFAMNIAYGVSPEDVNYEKVNLLVEKCGLTELVSSLANGIHTRVGERGSMISGGQRQRIGIARSIYQAPNLLILDEATSALDSITEKKVMNSIDELCENVTQIIIAHRVNTLKDCDVIYIFDNGNIVEQGTYSDLYFKSEVFKKLAGDL